MKRIAAKRVMLTCPEIGAKAQTQHVLKFVITVVKYKLKKKKWSRGKESTK